MNLTYLTYIPGYLLPATFTTTYLTYLPTYLLTTITNYTSLYL